MMDNATFKVFAAIGLIVNSALYLGGVLWVAVALGHTMAWRIAVIAIGVTYLSYFAYFVDHHRLAPIFTIGSIILGALAGIALVF